MSQTATGLAEHHPAFTLKRFSAKDMYMDAYYPRREPPLSDADEILARIEGDGSDPHKGPPTLGWLNRDG